MFNRNEIKTLMEALETWESAPHRDGMMTSMLLMGLGGNKDETPEERKARVDKDLSDGQKRAEERSIPRKEEAIMLKAKLLQMRASLEEEERVEKAQERS